MPDDPANPNPAQDAPTPPAADAPQDKSQPASPAAPENTKLAEELGKLKAENEALKSYQQQVDPVIQTIWSDQDTLKKVTEVHNKRLGITPQDQPANGENKPPVPPEFTKVENRVIEIRNNEVAGKINNFYDKHGINKLEEEPKQAINVKIGSILMEMLDPMGNKKDLKEVLEDVPLTKLDKFLEDAYFLATKDNQLDQARNEGRQESSNSNLGIIGSLPSESVSSDTVSLTTKERQIASAMGISEEKFLARKKEIATRGNQIY